MPPSPIAIGDIVQVIIGTKVAGQQCLNVLYYRQDTNQGPNTYTASMTDLGSKIASDAIDGVVPQMLLCQGSDVIVNFVQCQKVYPTREFPVRLPQNSVGDYLPVAYPPNVSAVISKQGETAGRGRTGSFHLPGPPAGVAANGSWVADYIAKLDALGLTIQGSQSGLVAMSKWNPGMFNPSLGIGLNFDPINLCTTQPTVRVVRRRTVGVGE